MTVRNLDKEQKELLGISQLSADPDDLSVRNVRLTLPAGLWE